MRLLIDNPFNTPFMRDDAADEPVALFECYRREHITLAFEVGTRPQLPAAGLPSLTGSFRFPSSVVRRTRTLSASRIAHRSQ